MAATCLAGAALGLAGCGRDDTPAPAAEASSQAATSANPGQTASTVTSDPARPVEPMGTPAAAGAPAFAALYPGGRIADSVTTASGAGGPGGLVTYMTQADPDTVIAFHKARAEAEGLSSVMAMNQGDARAYGASGGQTGANVQVVAAPTDDGETSVQLSWSAGA